VSTNFLPDLMTAIDVDIALDAEDEARSPEVEALGLSLAFDWRTLRFHITPGGDPLIVTEQAALLEDILKVLLTPRYRVPIYSPDYGADWDELIGQPLPFVKAEIPRIVTEALMVDPRIESVERIEIAALPDVSDGIQISFTVVDYTGAELRVPEVILRYG
jgi:hypothetical protein